MSEEYQPRLFAVDKVCCHCGVTKPLESFARQKNRPLGRKGRCKECIRLYEQGRGEINKETDRTYHRNNRKYRNEQSREYKRANDEFCKELDRRYYRKHRERIRERSRRYRLQNVESYRENYRRWREDNPESVRANHQRRRARWSAVPVNDLTSDQWKEKLSGYGGLCHWCGHETGEGVHMDHVIPISRGGSHTICNVVPSCQSCNQSKGAMLPEEWLSKLESRAAP